MRCNSFFPKVCRDMLLLLLFLMIFPSVICDYRWSVCNNASIYTEGSAYSTNLDRVVNDLSRNAPLSSGFNTSSHGQSPNKAYGLLQCIGNVSAGRCSNCSVQANNITQELCANDIGARVWMDDCFMRYDNSNFISTLDTNFLLLENTQNATSNMQGFISTTSSLLSNLSEKAYISPNNLLAVGSDSYSTSDKVYGLVQCWRDLSVKDCRSCLFEARQALEQCCSSRQGAQAMSASCTVRFEVYPFVESGELSPSPEASPPSATPDTIFSIEISSKNVSDNIQSFKTTISSLLSNLSSDLSNNPPYNGFTTTESAKYSDSDEVNGLVRCSSDLSMTDCRSCLLQAKQRLEECCFSKESVRATSKSCMLGYQVQKTSDLTPLSGPEAPITSPTSTTLPPVDHGRASPALQAKSSLFSDTQY